MPDLTWNDETWETRLFLVAKAVDTQGMCSLKMQLGYGLVVQ